MLKIASLFFISAFISHLALAAGGDEAEDISVIAMGDSLVFAHQKSSIDFLKTHEIEFRVVASGIGMAQTNTMPNDYQTVADIANAQIILFKNTGLLQFYLQSGYYSTPSLGTTYQRSAIQTKDSFGIVPLASVSVAPDDHWLISAGKLNSFGGYESTFSFQNLNIDRGLLWNQTSNVSKGFQVGYSNGPISTSVTLNDGYYSNQLSWMGLATSYKYNDSNSTTFSWAGAIKSNSTDTFVTPLAQNNSQIFNAIYNYKSNRFSFTPYLQYTYIPINPSIGILGSAQTKGAAILTNYRFNKIEEGRFSLPLRFEYITSAGNGNVNSPNMLYGLGSSAWSATITPTFEYQHYFVRAELSYVQAINASQGLVFGSTGTATNQTRLMMEIGLLY